MFSIPLFSRSCFALVLALAAALAPQTSPQPQAAAQPQSAIPDTPAGHTFKAWLDAFNSGDRVQLGAVTAVKGVEPGFEGVACRSIGNGGLRLRGRLRLGTRLRSQCSR